MIAKKSKPNSPDLTLRNIRAANKRLAKLESQLKDLNARVSALEPRTRDDHGDEVMDSPNEDGYPPNKRG